MAPNIDNQISCWEEGETEKRRNKKGGLQVCTFCILLTEQILCFLEGEFFLPAAPSPKLNNILELLFVGL